MIFVIGGSFNNKLEFVLEKFNLSLDDVYESNELKNYRGERIINNFHEIVKGLSLEGRSLEEIMKSVDELLKREDLIIISDEIGYGIVPIKKEDRLFRELNGRVSCYIANKADEVFRVMYGIGNRIKGE